MLEGKTVNLRLVEKEDLPLLQEWTANVDFLGDYVTFWQKSKAEWQKKYESPSKEEKWFSIEKKDGTKVGFMEHFTADNLLEIAYFLIPQERGKGYCAEAIQLIVDYLFLSKEVVRIQARTDARNMASQKALEKSGFTKEGIIRKSEFIRGEWRDRCLYSILREEWKEPKILTTNK